MEHPAKLTSVNEIVGLSNPTQIAGHGVDLGNDHKIDAETFDAVRRLFAEAGIGFSCDRSTLDASINKLFSVVSMGLQAAFDTKFGAAMDLETMTGALTQKMMEEVHAIGSKAGITLGAEDEVVAEQRGALAGKKLSPGSMHMAAGAGKRMEHQAIYGDPAAYAASLGVAAPYLEKTFELVAKLEEQALARKENLPAFRQVIATKIAEAPGDERLQQFLNADFSSLRATAQDLGGSGGRPV